MPLRVCGASGAALGRGVQAELGEAFFPERVHGLWGRQAKTQERYQL